MILVSSLMVVEILDGVLILMNGQEQVEKIHKNIFLSGEFLVYLYCKK